MQVVILSQPLYIRDEVVKFYWYQTAHHPNTHRGTQTSSKPICYVQFRVAIL